jgi:HPt (histidine-containing phosphotransfer) domain-containing protein
VISSDKQAAEALGISGWLHKPMNRKEIGQVLNAVLQGKETNELTQSIPTEDTKDKASLKAWNRAEMAERMVDNDVLLNNICSLFLDNLPQLQSSIQVAYSSRDAEEGALQAHTLKGAAANASAEQLHAVAKGLENAFRATNWERVERYVKELPEAIRVTEEAMLAHQERSQS